ncbi:bifunctional MaoC family dehydratase N-terminal/OB-fold nucleic acid binding domain-containing protein [Nonomuraea salmonea]|uniref:Bifunctional MaoC family dehydratase N-terminal/OB-fold nucleic acid binding domain-containing protein n=1 Tax=Nonomuraea salmonea TaxID=46181 RepID=A0ABV5P4M3_9ACTN
MSAVLGDEELHELAAKQAALGEVRGTPADDPVNVPMIRHWLTAMGDTNPVYLDRGLAPPAMAQVWTMRGPGGRDRSPVDDLLAALDRAGYTGVVATNCEQTYHRYVRVGERLTPATRLSGLAGPKRTALGTGYFTTWNVTWYTDEDEPVATMMFRVLKFRPPDREQAEERTPYPLRPAVNEDTAFFWEGAKQGELRIQACADCGERRHPPGPLCPRCRSANRGHTVASGEGVLFSYVVHHHPPVPGRETPFVVGVVELPEGVRVVGDVVGCPPGDVEVGMRLRVRFDAMDAELVLPRWEPA